MAAEETPNIHSISTRWAYKRVRVSTAPQAQHSPRRGPFRWVGLPKRSNTEKTYVTLSYRPGGGCWVLVEARGRSAAVEGSTALIDLLMEINQSIVS